MLCKLIRYDLYNGIVRKWWKFLLPCILFFSSCIDFLWRQDGYWKASQEQRIQSTFGDYIFNAFGGMKEYVPSHTDSFQFPVIWMLIFLLLAFMELSYPFTDLEQLGQSVLLRCKGRTEWWIAKCIWGVSFALVYFFLAYSVIFLFALCNGATISLRLSPYVANLFEIDFDKLKYTGQPLVIEMLVLPPLTAIFVSLLQMLLALYMKQQYSFIISTLLYLSSAYFLNPFFPGNYAMIARSDRYITNGVSANVGIIANIILIICIIALGIFLFQKYDIINRD